MKKYLWFPASMVSLILAVLAVPMFASTPELMGPPAPMRRMSSRGEVTGGAAKEKFFSGQNVALNLLMQGAGVADIVTTFSVVGHSKTTIVDTYPDGSPRTVMTVTGVEKNSLMRPFVSAGVGPAMAVKVVGNGAVGYISWRMRRSDNKATRILGWVLPVAASALQFKLAGDNARVARQLR